MIYMWLQGVVAFCDVRARTQKFRVAIKKSNERIATLTKQKAAIKKRNDLLDLESLQALVKKTQSEIQCHREKFNEANSKLESMLGYVATLENLDLAKIYPDTAHDILKRCVDDCSALLQTRFLTRWQPDFTSLAQCF